MICLFERKLWHFNRAKTTAIKRSMNNYPWIQHFNTNSDPNWQVKTFTEIFLNTMSNFIPNEIKKFVPRNPPWITKPLKAMINRKNRLFKNYKKNIDIRKRIKSGLKYFVLNVKKLLNQPNCPT